METMDQYKKRLQKEYDEIVTEVNFPRVQAPYKIMLYKRLSQLWYLLDPDCLRQWNESRRKALIENLTKD